MCRVHILVERCNQFIDIYRKCTYFLIYNRFTHQVSQHQQIRAEIFFPMPFHDQVISYHGNL